MAKQRFEEIDICKGIAILGVLWNHSFILHPINIHDIPWCQHAANINSTFFLVLFFIISGYLFSIKKEESILDTVKKKSQRLLIPYLSYSLINLLLKLLLPSLVNREVQSVGYYISKVFLFGGELWFVYTLFIMMVIWFIILPKINKSCVIAILTGLLISDFLLDEAPVTNYLLFTYFIHYSVFFLIGYLLRGNTEFRVWLQSSRSITISSILFLVLCCIFTNMLMTFFPTKMLLKLIGCWFMWSLSFRLVKLKSITRILSFFGKNSLGYYWLNGFALVAARTLIVSVLHISFSPAVAIGVWTLCIISETIVIKTVKKMPRLGMFIGV